MYRGSGKNERAKARLCLTASVRVNEGLFRERETPVKEEKGKGKRLRRHV